MPTKLTGQKVLIVGGAGFLGQHLIQDLVEIGVHPQDVRVLDKEFPDLHLPGSSYCKADITDTVSMTEIFLSEKPRVVFHMASPYPFETNRAILERVNITGTRNLIESARLVGTVSAFVYTSSSSVIHDHKSPLQGADESYPVLFEPEQPNSYSHTKAMAESIVLDANRKGSRMLTVALRPASMYGEGDKTQIPSLITNARAGRAGLHIGPGNNKFDNTYIKNLTHAHILAAEALLESAEAEPLPPSSRVEGEAFFVADDDTYTFPGFTRLVAEFAGHPVKPGDIRSIPVWLVLGLVHVAEWGYWFVTFGENMPFSTSVVRMLSQERTFNIEKIKTRLDYRPRYTTADGVKRAVDWFLGNEKEEMVQKKTIR